MRLSHNSLVLAAIPAACGVLLSGCVIAPQPTTSSLPEHATPEVASPNARFQIMGTKVALLALQKLREDSNKGKVLDQMRDDTDTVTTYYVGFNDVNDPRKRSVPPEISAAHFDRKENVLTLVASTKIEENAAQECAIDTDSERLYSGVSVDLKLSPSNPLLKTGKLDIQAVTDAIGYDGGSTPLSIMGTPGNRASVDVFNGAKYNALAGPKFILADDENTILGAIERDPNANSISLLYDSSSAATPEMIDEIDKTLNDIGCVLSHSK
jgi:hypothetical protein